MKKIAIIGAGLTGITIAQKLSQRFSVTVFEKSRGVGGRMATRFDDGFEFDHGAQYFTVHSEEFKSFIKPMIEQGVIARWDARFIELNGSEVINKRDWNASYPHYVGNPHMNAVCGFIAADLDVKLNTAIKVIKPGNKWQLVDDHDNDLGMYDWVIVTAPAEQASMLMPDDFQFKQAMMAIKMIGCYSVMLGFEFNPIQDFDAALVNRSDISWISVNSSKPNRPHQPTLLVHSSNEWAEANMNMDLDAATEHLCKELTRVAGVTVNMAKHVRGHRWRYANVNKQPNENGLIDFERQLAACGDWCLQGRVESAFLVGERVANQILATV